MLLLGMGLLMELLLLVACLPCPCLVLLLTVTLLMLHILKVHTLLVGLEVCLLPWCVPAAVGVAHDPLLYVLASCWLLKGPAGYLFFLLLVAVLFLLALRLMRCMVRDVLDVRLFIILLDALRRGGCLLHQVCVLLNLVVF